MLELNNKTNQAVELYPSYDEQGNYQYTILLKRTYSIDEYGMLTEPEGLSCINQVDEYYGDPLTSSLKSSGDLVPYKTGSEFYIYGGQVDNPRKAKAVRVKVEIKSKGTNFAKTLMVTGNRVCAKSTFGYSTTKPKSFESCQLSYENAYGGMGEYTEEQCTKNPAGKGFISHAKGKKSKQVEFPNIELANDLIKNPVGDYSPAGFGPIPPHWSPRAERNDDLEEKKNNISESSEEEDGAISVFNCAPKDQIFKHPFVGNEIVYLDGISMNGSSRTLKIVNPENSIEAWHLVGSEDKSIDLVCDTLIVDADNNELQQLWRATIAHDLSQDKVEWITVIEAEQRKEEVRRPEQFQQDSPYADLPG